MSKNLTKVEKDFLITTRQQCVAALLQRSWLDTVPTKKEANDIRKFAAEFSLGLLNDCKTRVCWIAMYLFEKINALGQRVIQAITGEDLPNTIANPVQSDIIPRTIKIDKNLYDCKEPSSLGFDGTYLITVDRDNNYIQRKILRGLIIQQL